MRSLVRTLLAIIVLCITATFALAQEPVIENILRHVTRTHGVSRETLVVVHETSRVLPLTGRTLHLAKIMDRATGHIYSVATDEAGNIVDEKALRTEESQAYLDRYGKLSPELFEHVQQAAPDETIPILIWLDDRRQVPSVPRPMPGQVTAMSAAEIEATQARQREQVGAAIARVQAPVRADIAALGGQVTYADRFAPVMATNLPPAAIRALESHSDVQAISMEDSLSPLLDSAAQTVRADKVWSQGITGTASVTVAVIEAGTVYPQSQHLSVAARYKEDYCSSQTCIDDWHQHVTGVAGVLAVHSAPAGYSWQGIAPGVRLINGNSDDASIEGRMAATAWALEQGAHVLNLSFGYPSSSPYNLQLLDRYYDYLVRHNYVTVVASAGNAGGTGCNDDGVDDGQIYSPARGFNVLAVGSFNDGGDPFWAGDGRSICSSYENPASDHSDREEPDVVAPGANIRTLAWDDGTQNVSGTSFAAPIVSAEAALLMQRNGYFVFWPEAVRAIIMASAIHNIEGDSRLSEYDGAGGVDLYTSDLVAKNGWWDTEVLEASDFSDNKYDISAYFEAGERVRVAIAWSSNPNSDYSTDPLEADLDLYIFNPDGSPVFGADSASLDNSYEIVEFEATQTGNHTISVYKSRFDGESEYLGVAWARIASPTISSLDVTSSQSDYFYNPGLDASGGTVYFNSQDEKGAGQTLTVSADWSAVPPQRSFDGDAAFGDDPPADTNATDDWTQTYSVETDAGTQDNVPFVVTDELNRTASAEITFQADNDAPAALSISSSTSGNDVSFEWPLPADASGIKGYSIAFDQWPATYPDERPDIYSNEYHATDLEDGEWCLHVHAVDNVGNAGPTAHHCVQIDTSTPTYTISGYVRTSGGSGIKGVVMNGLPGNPSTDGNGYYSVTVDEGWSGTITPQKEGYDFSPSSKPYSNVTSNQTQDYIGTLRTYTISGYVRTSGGNGISGVVMSGLPGNPTTDGNGYYSATVDHGWSAWVTPQKAGYDFSPSSKPYSNVTSNQTQDYTGTLRTYTISGYVRTSGGSGISGVVMSGLPGNPSTDGNGYYSATVDYGWSGTVTPQKAGYNFSPSSEPYTNVTSNQAQDYSGALRTYTISGYVRTSGGAGISEVVMSGLPGNPSTDSNGYYSVTAVEGWSGTVTPQKTGYDFSPPNKSYSGVTSNQSQDYIGTLWTYTVSGHVRTSGGSGISGVVMSGLPGNPSSDGGGYYSAVVDYGWSGTVTPGKTGYTFSPSSQPYSNVTSNQTQDYIGTLWHTISGSVRTSGGSGISGVVMNGLPGSPTTSSSGYYSAQVEDGWSGTVTPDKAGYAFSPYNRPYSNVTSNQSDQDYTGQVASTSGTILINEIEVGNPDWIEFYNPGSQAISMQGWQFKAYLVDDLRYTYIFPAFVLQPGAYVVLHEGSGTNTSTDLYTGGNSFPWDYNFGGAAALFDGGGTGVDFVRWGSSSVAPPSGTGWTGTNPDTPSWGQTLGRDSSSTDTNGGGDWTPQTPTSGAQNSGPQCYTLTRSHTGTGSDPVASPSNSVGCSSGSYVAGEIIALTASPGSGWLVGSWSGTDNDSTNSISNQLTMPASDRTVTVNYVPGADITINEVELGSHEWVEIYNADSQAVDMSSWKLRMYCWHGTAAPYPEYTFPASFTLQPGAYVVIHKTTGTDTATDLYTGGVGCWANSTQPGAVSLGDSGSSSVDFMRWGDWSSLTPNPALFPGTSWTGTDPAPPPAGKALGRDPDSTDTDDGSDWTRQPSTPGRRNLGTETIRVVINEVEIRDDQWIELYSAESEAVDVSGWVLTMYNTPGTTVYTIPADFILQPGAYVVISEESGTDTTTELYMGMEILFSNNVGAVALTTNGDSGVDFVRFQMSGYGYTQSPPPGTDWTGNDPDTHPDVFPQYKTLARTTDGVDTDDGSDWTYYYSTPGARNENPVTPGIVINEVHHDNPSEDWAELYNADSVAVDMSGWRFTAYYGYSGYVSVNYTFPDGFTLEPGTYLVIHEHSGEDSATDLYVASSFEWNGGVSGGAALTNEGGIGVDFVRWTDYSGWSPLIDPPPGTGWDSGAAPRTWNGDSLGRDAFSTDTDATADWTIQSPSQGIRNQCHALTLTHTGSGSDPVASSTNSTGCPTDQYVVGETVNLSASPADGWYVSSWNGTDNNGSTSTSNTLTMPDSDHTATVNYTGTCYTLTRTHVGSGSDPAASPPNSTGCSVGRYVAGESVSLSASPDIGWQVANWSGTDDDASTSTGNTLTMPASNRTVTVTYDPIADIVINEVELGGSDWIEIFNADSVAVDMSDWRMTTYNEGQQEMDYTFPSGFTLQPDAYVVVHEWFGTDTATDLYSGSSLTWMNSGNGAVVLKARGGSGVDFVRWGSSSISPPTGTSWTDSNPASPPYGKTLGRDMTSTDTDNGSDWTSQGDTAGAQNLCYPLTTAHTGSGGDPVAMPANSTGCSDGHFVEGETINLSARPDSGWQVGSWNNTDNDGSTSSTNSLTMPADDHTVTVNYVQNCYTLTLTHTGEGNDPIASPTQSTGCSAGLYTAGEAISLTASPRTGWLVGGWSGTNNDGSTSASIGLTMPASDHTAAVTYVPIVPNDDFDSLLNITSLPHSNVQDTTGATTASDDPTFSCGDWFSGQGYNTVWYQITPSSSFTITLDTFGSVYDTVLAVWTGARGTLQGVGCNDDAGGTPQSRMEFLVSAGTTYYIEIVGYDSSGYGILQLSTSPNAGSTSVFLPLILRNR